MTALREGSLFTGYNGLGMAVSQVFGSQPAWFAENQRDCAAILDHRYPGVPNLGDVTAVDWAAVEPVDVISGGFPCTDLSLAGRRAGLTPDTRSGLWSSMVQAIACLRPRYVVVENVRGLLSAKAHCDVEQCPWCMGDGRAKPHLRALGAVLGDLADVGYDARWRGFRASDIGAPHQRYRVFAVAENTDGPTRERRRVAAPGHTQGRQARADVVRRGRTPVADAENIGHQRRTAARRRRAGSADDNRTAADTDSAGLQGRSVRGGGAGECLTGQGSVVDWGKFGPAVERWELLLGRGAPAPTELAPRGGMRLSPRFVEWMQGLPAGHVTDVPGLSRNAQLRALGNGVVPQQAAAALQTLMEEAA